MSRKLQQNIFPHIRRQVYAVVNHIDGILPLQRKVAGPVVQFELILERFEATDALAIQDQMQTALHQQAVLQLLDLQFMLQRMTDLNDLVVRVNIQLRNRQAAFQMKVMRFQMAKI